jgi:Fic family protein
VEPAQVKGALKAGHEQMAALQDPFARAVYMMFLISEVHPFADGNGRIARIMMNAELIAAAQTRIIIPTVYREDYLLNLRRLSRQRETETYIRMLQRAHAWTHWLDPVSFEALNEQMETSNAYRESGAGLQWTE